MALVGPPGEVEIVGIASEATASTSTIAMLRTGAASNVSVPCRRPPARKASPSTSRLLPRIEPMSAVWTRTTRPSRSANSEMNSSGRLPSADWRTPVRPGPNRLPSWSVPSPTSAASAASVTAARMNTATSEPPASLIANVIATPVTAMPRMTTTLRPRRRTRDVVRAPGDVGGVGPVGVMRATFTRRRGGRQPGAAADASPGEGPPATRPGRRPG